MDGGDQRSCEEVRFSGALENLFTFNGKPYHEIVMIHDGVLSDRSAGSVAITTLQGRFNGAVQGYNFPMHNKQTQIIFASLSYVVGAVIGLFLVGIGTWADMESASYGFPRVAEAGLGGFYCPVLMTRNDAATISLTVTNRTDDRLSPSIRTWISTAALPEEFIENLELAPGESKKLEWRVDSENIDLGSFIFAKVLMYSAYPLKSRETTCGVFILNLPGSGKLILPTLVALSFLGMGWGLYALSRFGAASLTVTKNLRAMLFLSIALGAGFVFSLFSKWILSMLALTVILLTLIILSGPLMLSERKDQ